MTPEYVQVDAFSDRPLFGNPAAVVHDADLIPGDIMQRIARELNLSETVFLLKPSTSQADYRVRIFTPRNELPFAGHPTIAAAHAFLERFPQREAEGLLKQECGIGLVNVEILKGSGGRLLRMTQALAVFTPTLLQPDQIAGMLGCLPGAVCATPAEVVSTGVPWLIVKLAGSQAISRLKPDLGLVDRICAAQGAVGVTVFAGLADGGPVRFRLRTFAPGEGITEDPVCGSGNGSVAAYIARHIEPGRRAGHYLAEQGLEIGRDGLVHASWDYVDDRICVRIAGAAVTCARGRLLLA